MQQQIEVTKNGKYSNINLKDIDQDKFILVRKKFIAGLEKSASGKKDGKPYKYYAHNVMLVQPDGTEQEVSFLLYERDNQAFGEQGGVDDSVRIWCRKDKTRKNPLYITFEKVE